MRVSSVLLDDIFKNEKYVNTNLVEIGNNWYIAKPIGNYHNFFRRIIASYRVLIGKSMAVHYKETE